MAATSVETAVVENPVSQQVLRQSPKPLAAFTFVASPGRQTSTHIRSQAVDAVFDRFVRSFNHDDSAAQLLILNSNRYRGASDSAIGDEQDHSQGTAASPCVDSDAAAESLAANDFHQVRSRLTFKSLATK
jgi:hypothetical protein